MDNQEYIKEHLNPKFKDHPYKEILAIDSEGYPLVVRSKKGKLSFPSKNRGKKRQNKGCFGKSNHSPQPPRKDMVIQMPALKVGTKTKDLGT